MRLLLWMLGVAVIAFCVATVVTQASLLVYLWSDGQLDRDKLFRVLAVMRDVDIDAMRRSIENSIRPKDQEQASHELLVQARRKEGLDLDLRETALDKAVSDLRRLHDQLEKQQFRYDQMKNAFDKRLAELEEGARDAGILALQRALEAMHPKQAKNQILMILDEKQLPNSPKETDPMRAIVMVLKPMPVDKQKKIFAEFKTPEEAARLHDILREIRLGKPESDLYGNTRQQLQQFNERQP